LECGVAKQQSARRRHSGDNRPTAPLVCLVVAFLLFRGRGIFVPYFADGVTAVCAALGAMFFLSASAHWGKRRPDLIRMVPRGIGNAGL
jgi:hypothetical protein